MREPMDSQRWTSPQLVRLATGGAARNGDALSNTDGITVTQSTVVQLFS